MLALPTAKILLFIAMNLGPHQAPVIYATSNSESYVWTSTPTGWAVEGKGFPASDFTRNPSRSLMFKGNPPRNSIPPYLRVISRQDWSRNAAMVFDNGDRVEKCGNHAFYIIDAGGSDEKVFTILFPLPPHPKS
jgi:hypothetical protein